MRLYGYNKNSKEYIGYMDAYVDPLESEIQKKSVFVIPPYFTEVEPAIPKEGNTMVFDGSTWSEVEDHRGLIVYDKKTGKELTISELGSIPSGYQIEKPILLEELRSEKIKEVNETADSLRKEECEVSGIKRSVETWVDLVGKLSIFEFFSNVAIDDVVLTKEELEEILKYFHIRSMLIVKERLRLLKQINSTRSKKKLLEFTSSFNIEGQMQELMKLSKEELNERFK